MHMYDEYTIYIFVYDRVRVTRQTYKRLFYILHRVASGELVVA